MSARQERYSLMWAELDVKLKGREPTVGSWYSKKTSGLFIVDIDVGGTFTDAIISSEHLMEIFKVDTTPHDLSQCLRNVFEEAATALSLPDLRTLLLQTQVVRLSTSLSTNSLVERRGAQCGLILSRGWRTPYLSQKAPGRNTFPRVMEDMVVEIDAGGPPKSANALIVSGDQIRDKVQTLLERGASVIVISLAHGELTARYEDHVKALVARYYPTHFIGSIQAIPSTRISESTDVLERTNTAILNAYCHRAMARHFYQIEEFMRSHGYPRRLLVVHSNGGSARVAKTKAIHTINSGAAAGIFGVARLAKNYAVEHIISVDAGGTTTQIGLLVGGGIAHYVGSHFDDVAVDLPRPVAATLGIGGGSIAGVNADNTVVVGPRSAGAFPGPACYDLGGTSATLTDAYVILGYLDEKYFLGGNKTINKESARRAIAEKLGIPLGISCEDAAFEIKRCVVETIGDTIRKIADLTDLPVWDFALAAIGGGGGCVGADLFSLLDTKETYVFRQGSVFGAYGASGMEIMHFYEQVVDFRRLGDPSCRKKNFRRLNAAVADMQRQACRDMRGEGFKPEEIRFESEIEISSTPPRSPQRIILPNSFVWPAQDWPVMAELMQKRFGEEHETLWEDLRVSKLFLRALAHVPYYETAIRARATGSKDAYKGQRPMYIGHGRWVDSRVYEWDFMAVPRTVDGPAIIESPDTTVVVPPGMLVELDAEYNGVIRRKE